MIVRKWVEFEKELEVDVTMADILEATAKDTFSAPPPENAFETWWRNEFGSKNQMGKSIARLAWNAALAEMGCFDQ